jgi:aspartyl-tRNA(Asn)/glutamyl-tRNA(Gln) amidotransferase subunit A
MTAEPLALDLTDAARAVARREISSVELTRISLAAIERLQPALNCFIRVEAESALEQAAAADTDLARGVSRGPLHGVPLAHKDMYDRAGQLTTCGSKIRRDFRPGVTATALERLAGAGALYLGGLNMAEFAFNPTGHNEHWGHCRNPWDTARVTGGSSSGSGSAVAARLVYGALGSDTGGSIRMPAHLCGLAGLKPTTGLISRFGAMPLSYSLDTVGPLTRTVRDTALLTSVMAGRDPRDPTSVNRPLPDMLADLEGGVRGLRIGVPQGYFDQGVDPEQMALLEAARALYAGLGAELVTVPMPDMEAITALCNVVVSVEATTVHKPWMLSRPGDYAPQLLQRLQNGLAYPGSLYLEALNLRAPQLARFCEAVFGRCDVLMAPVLAIPTPTIAETDLKASDGAGKMLVAMTRFTRPINYLGLPSLSVPMGFTRSGMPAGFQIVGRPYAEPTLFRAGRAFEREALVHEKAPVLP